MKDKMLFVFLAVSCCWAMPSLCAQQTLPLQASEDSSAVPHLASGRIEGGVKDPSGAAVSGAKVEASNPATGFRASSVSDMQGRFTLSALPVGQYNLTVHALGFQPATWRNVSVVAGNGKSLDVQLRLPSVWASIVVTPSTAETASVIPQALQQGGNASSLLAAIPGVSLRGNGLLASVPLLHGLGDERARIAIDGMTVSTSCPQHMNPPLSYVAPASVYRATVIAGLTPVSVGGDSLGGTISIDSSPPVFARTGERVVEQGKSSGFYRSNGQNYGGAVSEWVAGRHLGVGYSGSWSEAGDYRDGSGHIVTSTYAQTTDHTVTLAAQGGGNLLVLRAGLHHIPYQGFVNERMDMVRNYATSLNLRYRRTFTRGTLDSRIFWQSSSHSMNIGHDKVMFPMAMSMFMPMNDHGTDLGYTVKYDTTLSSRQTLHVGNELHRFVLNDRWPPVIGMAPMMGPDSFISINNGRRIRLGDYAELLSKWTPHWSTIVGARNDTVWSNAGPVQGYSSMYDMDSMPFNAANRARTDVDADATLLVQYHPVEHAAFEFGYARKTRAPSLYERYAWSTNTTAATMIGWFGDGNAYVGSLSLKPEIAHTFGGAATLHGGITHHWHAKVSPYLTHVQDYIDVDTLAVTPQGMSSLALLRFANHNARLYGTDLSGDTALWNNSRFGQGSFTAVAGYLHGERLDTQTGLYQMMPFNLRLNLEENLHGWSTGARLEAVDRKSNVDPHRFEPKTPGYTLFGLHTAYARGPLSMSASVDNLLNKDYAQPLGGVNLDDFMAGMSMGMPEPVTGPGRSASLAMTLSF